MDPLALELNQKLRQLSPSTYDLLSELGKKLFFPKGIVYQSTLADSQAKKINATVGIATVAKQVIYLDCINNNFSNFKANDIYPYAASTGKDELRKLWKKRILDNNPSINYSISLPIVTQGMTHGISILGNLFADKETTVIVPNLAWDNYEFTFKTVFNSSIATYNFYKNQGFNLECLKLLISSPKVGNKLLLFLNFPSNPTGYTPTINEANKIRDILIEVANQGKKILVVCDDSYFGLFYDKNTIQESIFTYLAGQHQNIIVAKVDGITKEFFSWGFRVSFLSIAIKTEDPEAVYQILEQKIRGSIRAFLSSVSHPIQTIMINALKNPLLEQERLEKNKILAVRYEKIKQIVFKEEYQQQWHVYPFNSGYFFCLHLKKVSAKKLWELLLKEEKVGLIYFGDKDIRIAYSSVDLDFLENLVEIIYKYCQKLSS